MSLASLVGGLKRDHNVLLVPFGPKIFALVCLLQGLLDENLAVWRVSAGELEEPSQRISSEHTIAVETLFAPDFDPNAQTAQ